MRSIFLFVPLLTMACAEDTTDETSETSMESESMSDTETEADELTVQVSPSNGAKGVMDDQTLVLTFNMPMDQAAVEAAWTSESLPADDMTFSWNTEGTILAVDASAVLEHPAGGMDVGTYDYVIELSTLATSNDGVALEQPFSAQFATAREITLEYVKQSPSGSSNGNSNTVVLRPGDDASATIWHAFASFDLSEQPPVVVELYSAELHFNQNTVTGTPYDHLGNLTGGFIDPISALSEPLIRSAVRRNVVTLSDSPAAGGVAGRRTADMLDGVMAELDAGETSVTVRMEFDDGHDNGADNDYVEITNPVMQLKFLAE